MPDKRIDDLLKQTLHKRNQNKAEEAVQSLGKIARRKGKNRDEALHALKTAAMERPHWWARCNCYSEIGAAISAEDAEYAAFLEEHLDDEDAGTFCGPGLLRVKGKDIYAKLIKIIANKKISMETRAELFDQMCDHAKQRFHLPIKNVALDDTTEADLKIKDLKAWQAAGFPDAKPITLPDKELKKLGITLPDDYAKFLLKHLGEEYDHEGGQWRLLTADRLMETVNVDGQKTPAIRQLESHANSFKEVFDEDETEDHKGKPYPLSRLAEGVAIGNGVSGEVLYFDPADDHAVWVFHPDGGDVERKTKTFKTWLRQAEKM